jgi:hypothetical protein
VRKLNELDVGAQNEIEITNSFVALGSESDEQDINWAWESIKGNIRTELKRVWFCLD